MMINDAAWMAIQIPPIRNRPGLSNTAAMSMPIPIDAIRTVALDPESRTSNVLTRVLMAEVWGCSPRYEVGPSDLDAALTEYDAAVRIGDKALFEPPPEQTQSHDLAQVWTERET